METKNSTREKEGGFELTPPKDEGGLKLFRRTDVDFTSGGGCAHTGLKKKGVRNSGREGVLH